MDEESIAATLTAGLLAGKGNQPLGPKHAVDLWKEVLANLREPPEPVTVNINVPNPKPADPPKD